VIPAALTSTPLVKAAAVAAGAVSSAALVYLVASRETLVSRLYARYVHHLDHTQRLLFQRETGRSIARWQAISLGGLGVGYLVNGVPFGWIGFLVIALGPVLYLEGERKSRVARLEQQVDGFVVALANSLKTVPSPAAALQATAAVLQQPTRQEIEHVLKEMRVGSTLEQGLIAMSARVKSRWLDVAFSAVLIGLRVGGNLPVVLERTASTIREMNRLLGVVRTKTGEGRMQLWVLALFPLGVVFAFSAVQPGYFDPLQGSLVGQIAVGVAAVLWIGSLLAARKILTVDV
jgi:tight adherence protein B